MKIKTFVFSFFYRFYLSFKSIFHPPIINFYWLESFKNKLQIKSLSYSLKKGFSIIELLVVVSITLLITGGTIKLLLPYTLETQNLIHSQMSEGNFRRVISRLSDNNACTNTFSGKTIGQSVNQIKDENGIPLFDRLADDIFERNLKIVKMKTAPKKTLCSSIKVASAGNCPAGCSNPVSFPGACRGTNSNATKGYAELQVYFSRPNSLFEKEDEALNCSSSDQRGCYKQNCLLKLSGTPSPTGASGSSVGSCNAICSEAGTGGGTPNTSSATDEMKLFFFTEMLGRNWVHFCMPSIGHNFPYLGPRNGRLSFSLTTRDYTLYKIKDKNNNVINFKDPKDQERYGFSNKAYLLIKCNNCSSTVQFPIGFAYFVSKKLKHHLYLVDPELEPDNLLRYTLFPSVSSSIGIKIFEVGIGGGGPGQMNAFYKWGCG